MNFQFGCECYICMSFCVTSLLFWIEERETNRENLETDDRRWSWLANLDRNLCRERRTIKLNQATCLIKFVKNKSEWRRWQGCLKYCYIGSTILFETNAVWVQNISWKEKNRKKEKEEIKFSEFGSKTSWSLLIDAQTERIVESNPKISRETGNKERNVAEHEIT